jgi:general secretion pathway protein D
MIEKTYAANNGGENDTTQSLCGLAELDPPCCDGESRVKRRGVGLLLNALLVVSLALPLPVRTVCAQAVDAEGTRYVNFSFDQVDIRLLARLVGQETGRQFVLDESVKGEITIITPPQIPVDEVVPLFMSILEASGYTVLQEGDISRIVPLEQGQGMLGTVVTGDSQQPREGLITKVIQLTHIDAIDFVRMLEPMLGANAKAKIAAFGPTNHIIVTDTSDRVARIEKIARELDVPGSGRSVVVMPLEYASAEDVAQQVMAAMTGSGKAGTRLSQHVQKVASGMASLPTDAVVVAAPHANSLVLVGTPVQIKELQNIISMLDTENAAGQGPLNAIFLEYLDAEEAAKTLNALLEKKAVKDEQKRIAIEADIINNALLIDAAPRDFDWITQLVKKLDRIPHQVMVEVLIAEVSLGTGLDLGVEWSTIEQPNDDNVTMIGRSRPGSSDTITDYLSKGIFPQGVTLGLAKGMYTDASGNQVPLIPFLVTALSQDDNVKILSNVPLWAQNNKEASVSVVKNIPMLKSTVDKGAGTASDTIQNIERKDVGITLTVTPHVNPNRDITLELHPVIEAITDQGEPGKYTPTFARREVQTFVTVPDGSTIAITGMIREDTVTRMRKVPFLGDIPLIGFLFRHKQNVVERTNLLIFVTPQIVTDMKEAMELKRAWEQRTDVVKAVTNIAVSTSFEE